MTTIAHLVSNHTDTYYVVDGGDSIHTVKLIKVAADYKLPKGLVDAGSQNFYATFVAVKTNTEINLLSYDPDFKDVYTDYEQARSAVIENLNNEMTLIQSKLMKISRGQDGPAAISN